jgi:anti-anti-sigma factor
MQPAAGLGVTMVADGEGALVMVEGEIDITTADQLAGELERARAAGSGDVTVDLAGVSFLDSTGIAVLVKAFQALEPAGRRLIVRNPRPAAQKTLEITALAELFGLHPEPPRRKDL